MKETTETQTQNGLNEADALKKEWVKPEIQLMMVNLDVGAPTDMELDGPVSDPG